MLAGQQFLHLQRGADCNVRQLGVVFLAGLRGHHAQEAVKFLDASPRPQREIPCRDIHHRGEVFRRRHLAGDELPPDQVVETHRIALHAFECVGGKVDVRGSDGLVGFLGAVLARVDDGLGGQVARAVLGHDELAHSGNRVSAQIGGVGSHVADETGLVETLGQGHGLLHAEAQARAGGLLQRGGDERR